MLAHEVDPRNDFVKYTDHVKDDLYVNSFYQFFTHRLPAEIAVRVERVICRMNGKITISPKDNISHIRATVELEYDGEVYEEEPEEVVVSCKQFVVNDAHFVHDYEAAPEINEGTHFLVSFKRVKGSHLAYKELMEELWATPEIKSATE